MWREKLAAAVAQAKAIKAVKTESKTDKAGVEAGVGAEENVDLEVTTDGQTIRAVSTATSQLPATIEQRTMRVTIAIVDVSGSMSSYLHKIDEIVCACNRKSSAANLPPGQFVVICFSDRLNDVIDMSMPLEPGKIAQMSGGTSYAVAFGAAREHIEETRAAYPDAQFTIAFMTDGQDCDRHNTSAALQALHAAMRPDDQMTSVFFAERASESMPKSLTNTSKPAIDKVPVMLLSNTTYFTSWLAGAVEKSTTNLTLELPFGRLGPGSAEQGAVGPAEQRMMLNNNGETLSGARAGHWPLVLASARETVVEAKIVAGTMTWPCKVRVKRSAETIALTGQSLLQMLQSALRECLQATLTQAEHDTALAQIREIIQMSENPEVRKALTATEIEMLRRAAAGAQMQETSDALTSQKVEQQQTFQQLLSSLALNTQWSVGRVRRAARNVDKLRARLAQGKTRVEEHIAQLQEALVALQEERSRAFDAGSPVKATEPKVDNLVTLGPIEEPEVLVSLWTGPPNPDDATTDEARQAAERYKTEVAANMGGVRAQPLMASPWIGISAWAQMCGAGLSATNTANVGVPVLPITGRTPAEERVVELFAPLLCGLFAIAQPMLDSSYVAAAQLLTTIGHVLQVVDEKAHEFADVLVPYAWHLVQKLDPQNAELCTKFVSQRNKAGSSFVVSATAWLGYIYCAQRMHLETGPELAHVYVHEALRQAAKRLHNSSDERNTKKLVFFCNEVAQQWTRIIIFDVSTTAAKVATQSKLEWHTPATLAQATEECLNSNCFDWSSANVMCQVRKILDVSGSALHASNRLQSGALKPAHWFKGWDALPTPLPLSAQITDLERVRTNFVTDTVTFAEADRGIGQSQVTNLVKERLIDAALVSQMPPVKRWTIMHLRDVDLLRDETGAMPVTSFDPVGLDDKERKAMLSANIELLATRPSVQAWFAEGVRQAMAHDHTNLIETINKLVSHPMLLRDARVQYWLVTEFKCSISEFAAYQADGVKLWKDVKRRSPTMNAVLSKPGQVVVDKATKRVVNKVVFDTEHEKTVLEVTFLDGTTMRRTKYGGQRNSVTAGLLCKQFETQQVFTRVCVTVDASHGPLPFVKNQASDRETVMSSTVVPGFSNVTGYVCAWDKNKWMLEALYQWSPERNEHVDAIAAGSLTYFEDAA